MPRRPVIDLPDSYPRRVLLGRLVITPGARDTLRSAGVSALDYVLRHAACDWGDLDADDRALNDRALPQGDRVLSAYTLPSGQRFYVVTEADRSFTTVLLADEY